MADTILGGDFTVYYLAENRQKRIEYTGAGSTYSVNQLYSALADLMDELNQMDDGTAMSAQTPTEYTIGIIDPGDAEPWFIDNTSVEYLYGGAIQTNGWYRVTGTNNGIVKVDYTAGGTALTSADIGRTITVGTQTGTILDYNATSLEMWIRPTNDTATHDWGTGGTATITGSSANPSITGSTNVTGELLWANIYNTGLATLQPNTHQYIEQNGALLTAYKDTSDWWDDGQFDILVQTKELGALGTGSASIDYGYIRVLARQYTTSYAWFQVDISAGGRNPIPLSSGDDLDNATGYRTFTMSGDSNNFSVGDAISHDATNPHGIITAITGTTPTRTLVYYLIGDPITDFANTDTVTNLDDTGTGTVNGAPTDTGPAALGTPPTITFGYVNTEDVNEDGTAEDYSINIDVNQNSLADLWEWLKYVTRRGNSGDIDSGAQTIEGQFYRGIQRRFTYSAQSGSFTEGSLLYFYNGSNVLQARGRLTAIEDAGATGELMVYEYITVVASPVITKVSDADPYSATNSATIDASFTITPIQKCPLGDFAGGTFFGADGVVLTDYLTSEANSFQLKDNQGIVVQVPTKISVTIGNTRVGDSISVFRLVTGEIQKDRYNVDGTQGAAGSTTLVVGTTINNDEPGKSTGGVVRVVDVSGQIEDRYRFSSWLNQTFTLATTSSTATGGSATSLVDSGANFTTTARVGDIIYNSTEGTYGYVESITNATTLVMTNRGSDLPVTDWNGDAYTINGTVRAYTTSDTVYVPIIDAYETAGTSGSPGSEGANLTYVGNFDIRIRARQAGVILPYEADAQVTNSDFSNNVIRTADTIYTP